MTVEVGMISDNDLGVGGSTGIAGRGAGPDDSSQKSVDFLRRSDRPDFSHEPGDDCKCPPVVGAGRQPRELNQVDRDCLAKLSASLSSGQHGTLHLRTEAHFNSQVRLFNRSIVSPAFCVVKPLDTRGVQLSIIAAKEAGWSVSVKAGGYGSTGWAVQGDLVLDLSRLNGITVHLPDKETGEVRAPAFPVECQSGAHEPPPSTAQGKRRTATEAFGQKQADEAKVNGDAAQNKRPMVDGTGRESSDPSTDASSGPETPDGATRAQKYWIKDGAAEPSPTGLAPVAEETQVEPNGVVAGAVTPPSREGSSATPPTMTGGSVPAMGSAGLNGTMTFGDGFSRNPSEVIWHGAPAFLGRPPVETGFPFSAQPIASTSAPVPAPRPALETRPRAANGSTYSPPLPGGMEGAAGMLSQTPAYVTFGAGVKAKDLDTRTSEQGYHVPVSAYPVGGAIFSTGGFGFLSRLKGLSMDNVIGAELVLSDGRIVHLTEDAEPGSEEEELWWAFRGVGTALGVVTRLRCKAWKVGLVHTANIIYPFNHITAPSLLMHWRDCVKNAPPELYANLILTAGPQASSSVVVIQMCYFGPQVEGDRFVSAITSWEGKRPLLQDVGMCTLLSQLDKVAMVLDSSRPHSGNRWCIRSDLLDMLSDQTIYDTCRMFKDIPERSAWLFEIAGQAIADIAPSQSCFPRKSRAAPFQVAAIHQWTEQSADTAWTNAAINWIDNTISPHSPGGPYPCFLETRSEQDRFVKTFGGEQNWDRLKRIKRRADPTGMFEYTLWPQEDSIRIQEEAKGAARDDR